MQSGLRQIDRVESKPHPSRCKGSELQHGFLVEQHRSVRQSFDLNATVYGLAFQVEISASVFHSNLEFRNLVLRAIGKRNIITSWVFGYGNVLDSDINSLCRCFPSIF